MMMMVVDVADESQPCGGVGAVELLLELPHAHAAATIAAVSAANTVRFTS
jgi:hypothetical protein